MAALTVLTWCVAAGPAAGAPAKGAVEERPVPSASPDARMVRESYVRVYDPLPASAGPHPEACDWIGYLRFRHPRGAAATRDADSLVMLMPGILAGAASFDQVARNTIRTAAARGRYTEVWGIDRRANCLEDLTGVAAADRARNGSLAYDYYWNGKEVGGRRFGGFVSRSDAAFLGEFGLERTVRDWHTMLTRAIPEQRERSRKVICAGHSLGGPLTGAFASWDFDGKPETTVDAGYNQCAGLAGLDTTLGIAGTDGGSGGAGAASDLVLQSGASPYIDAPPLTPETFQLTPVFAVGAYHTPNATDLLRNLPHTTNIDFAQKVLFSRDAANFATGSPSIRDFTLSNEVTFGGVFDDNSAGLSILRASMGFVVGGPLAEKKFPAPDPTLAIPSEPETPLYRWQPYDEVGRGGTPIALNEDGQPFTTHESEVSDLRQVARLMFEAPTNFIEQYFPTRILTDVVAAEGGDRSGSLENLRHDGPAMRPALLVQAGDSDDNSAPDEGPPQAGKAPNDKPLSRELIIPGYNHLDVATAAWRQNDGRPEATGEALADFTLRVVPATPAMRVSVTPRRVRRARTIRYRFRVRSAAPQCRAGVRIAFGGKRVKTGPTGRAALRILLRRAGMRRVAALKPGCRTARVRVRVLPR